MAKKSPVFVEIGGGLWRRGSAGWKWAKRNLVRRKPKPPHPPLPEPKPKPRPTTKLPIEGCDYVSGPTPAELKAAGKQFVCRYLSTPGNPKNLTKAEAARLRAADISIVLVFETTAKRALSGFAVGKDDARSARAQARAIGVPDSVPLYFAVDFDPVGAELARVAAYIQGTASILGIGGTGVYGGIDACKACHSSCHWFWQTYAWSGGKWYEGNHIEQYANGVKIGGHSVDLDRAVKAEYGQWAP